MGPGWPSAPLPAPAQSCLSPPGGPPPACTLHGAPEAARPHSSGALPGVSSSVFGHAPVSAPLRPPSQRLVLSVHAPEAGGGGQAGLASRELILQLAVSRGAAGTGPPGSPGGSPPPPRPASLHLPAGAVTAAGASAASGACPPTPRAPLRARQCLGRKRAWATT